MNSIRLQPSVVLYICAALFLGSCREGSQEPLARPEPSWEEDGPEMTVLRPVDLVYVCGNKFLATNSTGSAVHVTYRVVGTSEAGSLTLGEEPGEDLGHSETELETRERGVVELYNQDERVARRRNEGLPCGAAAGFSGVAAWAPVDRLASGLLHSACLLWQFTSACFPLVRSWPGGRAGCRRSGIRLLAASPVPQALHWSSVAAIPLADGSLLVAGGHITAQHGLSDISIFNPGTNSWSRSAPMLRGRWYPTTLTLANNDVVMLAGTDEIGLVVEEPEVWSSGGVRVLTSASRRLPYYPRAFLAPNGKIFYAGSQQTTRYLHPAGSGSWSTVASRLYGARDYGAAVMYDAGKILYVGGGRTTTPPKLSISTRQHRRGARPDPWRMPAGV